MQFLFSEVSHQRIQESYLLLEMSRENRNVCDSVSGPHYIGLRRQPTLGDTKVVEPGSRDLIQACPKIQHLMWDSSFNISNPIYSQHHTLFSAVNERQVKKVLHPLTYLLTSLLRHSYNLAIPVHYFYPIIKFWASHHGHSKCTGQTCRVKGDFALIVPKGLPQ